MTVINPKVKYQNQEVGVLGVFDDSKTALGIQKKYDEPLPSNPSNEFYSNQELDESKLPVVFPKAGVNRSDTIEA